MPNMVNGLIRKVATVLPEGVKGKSFLERGTTPMRERYIGNAKMFEEAEKSTFLKTYQDAWHYQNITNPLYDVVEGQPLVNQMQYIDILNWMRGDILLKVIKMTMANILDLRVHFIIYVVFRLDS